MRRLSALLLLLAVAACDNSSATTPPPLGIAIGPAGGSLLLGTGTLQLDVPPGALATTTVIRITADAAAPIAGWIAVSPAFRFLPEDLTFAASCTLLLPYSAASVSAAVADTELRVAQRTADGTLLPLTPSSASSGFASVALDELGTFWVIAPDVVDAASLFPLGNGDVYTFDTGLSMSVQRTASEPNLAPTTVAKIAFTGPGAGGGLYFDDAAGQLALAGSFRAAAQFVFDDAAQLIDARDDVGTVRPVATGFAGYAPFGQTTPDRRGLAAVTTTIVDRATVAVPLGAAATVHVLVRTRRTADDGSVTDDLLELWCAPDVGPIAMRLADGGVVHSLVSATVAGQPVGL